MGLGGACATDRWDVRFLSPNAVHRSTVSGNGNKPRFARANQRIPGSNILRSVQHTSLAPKPPDLMGAAASVQTMQLVSAVRASNPLISRNELWLRDASEAANHTVQGEDMRVARHLLARYLNVARARGSGGSTNQRRELEELPHSLSPAIVAC